MTIQGASFSKMYKTLNTRPSPEAPLLRGRSPIQPQIFLNLESALAPPGQPMIIEGAQMGSGMVVSPNVPVCEVLERAVGRAATTGEPPSAGEPKLRTEF